MLLSGPAIMYSQLLISMSGFSSIVVCVSSLPPGMTAWAVGDGIAAPRLASIIVLPSAWAASLVREATTSRSSMVSSVKAKAENMRLVCML